MKNGGRDGEGKDRKEGEDRVRPSGPPPSGPPPSGSPRKDSWLDERTMVRGMPTYFLLCTVGPGLHLIFKYEG